MNKTIILGSEGLIGKEIFNYLTSQKEIIKGIDKKVSLEKDINQIEFDISKLQTQDDFNNLINKVLGKSEELYLSLIDCLLIKSEIFENSLKETHKSLLGYLSTSLSIAKWFGNYCYEKKISGNMIMISSVKGFYPPKFSHYENLSMKSDVEYGVSKAGINYAAKDLSVRFNGIVRYNCIAPGGIEGEKHSDLFLQRYNDTCLIKPGLVKPLEIAKLSKLLISPTCPIIGQTIIVDNGWSLS